MPTMKILLCIFLFICLSFASNVNRIGHGQGNVLFFEVERKLTEYDHKQTERLDAYVANSICENPKYFCSNNRTCCKQAAPNPYPYACCPFVKGVCCQDGKHCCPFNSYCDEVKRQCYRETESGREVILSFEEIASANFSPVKKAACCSDGIHCCPNGYSCDVSAGTCTKGSDVVKWMMKKLAKTRVQPLTSVVCPDGQSECPDGNTCCKLTSGQWGCCPLPKAVCCSDGVHCCPEGYTCGSGGMCTKGASAIEWSMKQPAKTRVQPLTSVVCPDGKSECPDGNTCCKLASGQWGCCPDPQAVCCSDGIHCCPNGYTCDVSAGTCTKGSDVVEWMMKKLAKTRVQPLTSVVCPDGQSECPDGNTCCKLTSGQWGCCPLPKAVCCSDGVHCCPEGYTCGSGGVCTKGASAIEWSMKQPAKTRAQPLTSVVCPDGQSECPDGNTCCKLASGQWGCCPDPQAVCCSDGIHCCPNGYTCDVSAGTCTKGSDVVEWMMKKLAKTRVEPLTSVVCPDGQSECPDGNTCCKLTSGQWGCCPDPQAVCCSDGIHCCPNGYTCDVSAGTCTKGSDVVEWMMKKLAKTRVQPLTSVVCPDGQSECPDGNTCCKLTSGQWGCCPLPKAVCCSDGVHCCPEGYTCGSGGVCTKGASAIEWSMKQPAKTRVEPLTSVVCPDGQSECPDGNTCCKLASGQWGCCPDPQAVCCSDGIHCCPNGYTCDVSAGTCTKGSDVVEWMMKKLAKTRVQPLTSVVCPDGQSECPDGNTCCKLTSGQWGCCPLPKAVCCSDGVHCCPDGYTCGSAGVCTKGASAIEWSMKQPAKTRVVPLTSVVCPDGKSECPDGNTCCKLASGQWGCCPDPQAVCCSDGIHCCPNGYTCDVSAGTCTKGSDVVEWMMKKLAKTRVQPLTSVVCPDGQSECPDGNTCCKLTSGQWGCCPLPKAVCCSDGVHCCPDGYTCGSAGVCTKGASAIEWSMKQPAKTRVVPLTSVVCPDGKSECPDGNTCCKLASGQWGCCPDPQAVCCSDGIHCCPNGYTCDVSAGTCTKGSDIVEWMMNKLAKTRVQPLTSVVCPDGQSECPDGNTCCKLTSGQWGCCPLPKAVCCSDGVHCCPDGYTCGSAGVCTKGASAIEWSMKQPAKTRVVPLTSVVCPDGKSECPDGNTCCKLASGQWGCCPDPQAVCCSDGIHCCPNGYTCDVSAGTCTKGSDIVEWMMKKLAKTRVQPLTSVVCPDGQSECPDGNTCCKLTSGQWGCCPLPKAVCCSDGVHCCPEGYTCGSGGMCTKGASAIEWVMKKVAKTRVQPLTSVVCPDGQSECPDGNTCCKLTSGQWGCCPLPKAVCCSDGVHCCPEGYTCGSGGMCTKGASAIEWSMKQLAKTRVEPLTSVVCPDGQSECPDGNTCCKLASGQWGCCPEPQAVCCSDGIHCCPNGYTCDVSAGTCTKGSDVVEWMMKKLAKIRVQPLTSVVCPDGQSECPDGNTCCKLTSGQWGCCPLPKAVCCSDGVHCCPEGYTCGSGGVCTKGASAIEWSMKQPAKTRVQPLTSVVCPDGKSECPDGNTCCKLASGQWGCCPDPQAVCCSDGIHCCPNGYTCDVSAGTCTKGSDVVEWMMKKLAKTRVQPLTSVVCPDGQSECPDGNTCCKLTSGQWGCCPLPKAVCCSDGVHCCPEGYTCGSGGMCTKGASAIEWSMKQPAKTRVEPLTSVVCPDGQSECPDGNTCCKLASGQWGCCPLPKVV